MPSTADTSVKRSAESSATQTLPQIEFIASDEFTELEYTALRD